MTDARVTHIEVMIQLNIKRVQMILTQDESKNHRTETGDCTERRRGEAWGKGKGLGRGCRSFS